MTPSAAVGEALLLEVAEHLARVPIPGMNATARAVYSDKLLEQCRAMLVAVAGERDAAFTHADETQHAMESYVQHVNAVDANLADAERKLAASRGLLMWLDSRGGLGLDVHERIQRTIADTAASAEEAPGGPAQLDALTAKLAEAERKLAASEADKAYLTHRLQTIIPLFEEARDALPAITLSSATMKRLDLTLGDRMGRAGTDTREKWDARQSAQAASQPSNPET